MICTTRPLSAENESQLIEWIGDNQSAIAGVTIIPMAVVPDSRPVDLGARWEITFHDTSDEAVYCLMRWG